MSHLSLLYGFSSISPHRLWTNCISQPLTTHRFCYILLHQAPLPCPPSSNKKSKKSNSKHRKREWKTQSERDRERDVTSNGGGEQWRWRLRWRQRPAKTDLRCGREAHQAQSFISAQSKQLVCGVHPRVHEEAKLGVEDGGFTRERFHRRGSKEEWELTEEEERKK